MPPTAGSSTADRPPAATPAAAAVLYLDVGHPESLLAAERALQVMPVATEWIPVHLGPPNELDLGALGRVAAARGLQPLKAHASVPFDAEAANLAATYAKSTGRAVAFLQAALRQAYAGGRDLSQLDNVLIAASACELHPRAVLKAIATRTSRRALEAATATARERGATRAPSVFALGRLFTGDGGLDEAAALLLAHGSPAEPGVAAQLAVIPPRRP